MKPYPAACHLDHACPAFLLLPKVFDRMLKQKLKGTNVLVRGRWLAGLIVVLYPHQL